MARYLLFFLIFALISLSRPVDAKGRVFSEDSGRVDLSQALSFEEYLQSGAEGERRAVEKRFESYGVLPFFEEGAKKIEYPTTLLMIGMMYCPDCKAAYPYLETIARLNPLIRTKYIVRNDTPGAREFMASRTRRSNMPSVFVLRPDGKVLDGAYVETPAKVTELLAAAATEGERDAIWDDFHSGLYDEDIQRDLLELISKAAGGK
jgi:glutaredoxin